LLNCFVPGDNENNVFSVEIAKNKNVSILKDEIKKKKVHLLNHVDASDLEPGRFPFLSTVIPPRSRNLRLH